MALKRALTIALLFAAVPAYANNHPAGPVFLGILGLPLMMLFLTLIAGGYPIRDKAAGPRPALAGAGKVLAVFALILFAAISEGYAFLVLVVFAVVAIVRGIQLLRWGILARRADHPHYLEKVSPLRLAICGWLLLLIAIPVGGFAFAFTGTSPPPFPQMRVDALRSFVALQMAGEDVPYEVLSKRKQLEAELIERMNSYHRESRVIVERRNGTFTIFMLPGEFRFPFFPYNYMFAAPSYRADQTGAIRMAYVRHRNERCAPNAPMVLQVGNADVQSIRQGHVIPPAPWDRQNGPAKH